MWTNGFLEVLAMFGAVLAACLATIAVVARVKRNRRAGQVAASACGVIVVAFFLVWLQGFLYAHQSEEQQAQSIANLPPQAKVKEVNRGDWNDGEIVFTLPQTKPIHVWMAAIWRMNLLKNIDLSQNVAEIKTNGGGVYKTPSGLTANTATIWAGKQKALDNKVTLTYNPKTMEYTYASAADL